MTTVLSVTDEEAIEVAYWRFDAEKKSSTERDAFKGQLRSAIRRERERAAEIVKHNSHADGIGMGCQSIEQAIRGETR